MSKVCGGATSVCNVAVEAGMTFARNAVVDPGMTSVCCDCRVV